MCGRIFAPMEPSVLAALLGTSNPMPNFAPRFNLGPGQDALVVRHNPQDGARHLDPLFWGLIPPWAKDVRKERKPINARAETIASSPLFKGAFARHRCLVPAAAFFEWRRLGDGSPGAAKRKQPYAVARADGQVMTLAGIWSGHKDEGGAITRSFAIVTTEANSLMSGIHDRMPVVIEPADWPLWLGEAQGDPSRLMHPAAQDVLRLWPVSPKVNNVRNNEPDLLEEHREAAEGGGPNPG
jgi:putative SOS response-associated peptidase YedK